MLTARFTQEYLRSIFDYNPETGICKWLSRPRTDFRYAKDHKVWNKKHTGYQIVTLNPATGRVIANLFQRSWNVDQLIYIWMLNEEPPNLYHANRCNADNRWGNLTIHPQKATRYSGGDLQLKQTEHGTYAVYANFHTFNIFEDLKDAKTFMLEMAHKLQVGWSNEV